MYALCNPRLDTPAGSAISASYHGKTVQSRKNWILKWWRSEKPFPVLRSVHAGCMTKFFLPWLTLYTPCESDAVIAASQDLQELKKLYDDSKKKEDNLKPELDKVKAEIEKLKGQRSNVQKRPRHSGERRPVVTDLSQKSATLL